MIRKPKTVAFWTRRLPHWEVEDGRYFITIHVAGAIPAPGRARLRQMADALREVPRRASTRRLRLQRRIFAELERWLDRCQWNPCLAATEIAQMVARAIEHRQQRGDWNVFEYVVMPTHVHLFCEVGSQGLKRAVEDFKRWTGHEAAKLLSRTNRRLWQGEWFDHWSRSDEEDDRIITYIRNNPVKAGLVREYQAWPHASWHR